MREGGRNIISPLEKQNSILDKDIRSMVIKLAASECLGNLLFFFLGCIGSLWLRAGFL